MTILFAKKESNVSFTRAVTVLLRSGATQAALAHELNDQLHRCQSTDKTIAAALEELLEGIGRAASPELLAAVREVLRLRGLNLSVRLGELLLRGYLGLHLQSEFQEVFAELESPTGTVQSITALALKRLW